MNDSILCGAHINGIALLPEFIITLPDGRRRCKICGEIMRKSESSGNCDQSMKRIEPILKRYGYIRGDDV